MSTLTRYVFSYTCLVRERRLISAQAVIRVSKQFLPHMSECYNDPRVEVHIGDGFKFLPDHKNEYDVIVTDSSDPVGPAEALFQPPYFQLLKDALKEGGNLSTQGECLWLHLPLIKELRQTCKKLFPSVGFAFVTIPTCASISYHKNKAIKS